MKRSWPNAGLAATMLLLVATGCHKARVRVSGPATAPTATNPGDRGGRSTRAGGASSGASSGTKTAKAGSGTTAAPPVAGGASVHGRPVSTEVGLASWYGPPYNKHKGADGTVYDQNAMTAAHRTLPMGTTVRVTNLATNESAVVRITDRGPFVDGRILDLSLAAAKATGLYRMGVAKVRVEAFAPPKPDLGGRWCVQIGAFLDEADAVQLKNDLTRRYETAKVIEFSGPTGYWVRINPQQTDKSHAAEIADSIHIPDPGTQPYLVRLN